MDMHILADDWRIGSPDDVIAGIDDGLAAIRQRRGRG